MSVPITLNNVANLQSTTTAQNTINSNNTAIVTAFGSTLNVAGDQMVGALDMNNQQILNLPAPATLDSPVRLIDVAAGGSAAISSIPPTGTSGSVVGFLNGNLTFSGTDIFSGGVTFNSAVTFTNTVSNTSITWPNTTGTSGQFLTSTGSSTTPLIWTSPAAGGSWNNTYSHKTAAYSVATADAQSTLGLGGSTWYTVAFGVASTYASTFTVVVANEDTTRGKTIVLTGGTNLMLWPGQTIFVFNENNSWNTIGEGRWILPSSQTWYTDHGSGSDSILHSDGLATGTGAFATIQNAVNVIFDEIDCNGNAPTIQTENGTFTEAVSVRGYPVGYLELFITGNPTNPSSVAWQVAPLNSNLSCRDGGTITLNGFTMLSTGTASNALQASQFGVIDFSNIIFQNYSSGTHISAYESGNFNAVGNYTVTGNANQHIFIQGNSNVIIANVVTAINSNPTMTQWLLIEGPGYFQGNGLSFTGVGAGSGTTALKYNISLNGVALTGGVTLPGSTAGVTATGGQYN
jgi:hypothetical protein